jgi:hypothetical protein
MPCHILLPTEVSIGFRLPALAHEHLSKLFGTPRGAAVKQGVAFSAPVLRSRDLEIFSKNVAKGIYR